jgi:hypothetical protein
MRINKKAAAVAVAAVTLAGSGIAYAYWSTTGAGSGTGTTAASNGTLALHATFPTVGLYPGGAVAVSFTADNTVATDLQVGTVHSVVTTSDPTNCLASWFSIADVIENQTITHNTNGVVLAHDGSLVFANDAADQNLCKGATITLTLTS